MRVSRNRLPALGYVALATSWTIFGAVPASADVLWDWSYSCSLLTTQTECKGGSGTFTTTNLNGSGTDGYYVVTGMTGEVEGNTITSLIPPGGNGKNDNKLSISGGIFNNTGSAITGLDFYTNDDTAQPNELYDVYIDYVVGYYTQLTGPGFNPIENLDFKDKQVGEVSSTSGDSLGDMPVIDPSSLLVPIAPATGDTSVPEPSSLLVLTTAAALMFGVTLRKVLN